MTERRKRSGYKGWITWAEFKDEFEKLDEKQRRNVYLWAKERLVLLESCYKNFPDAECLNQIIGTHSIKCSIEAFNKEKEE